MASTKEVIEFLHKVPLFQTLTHKHLEVLAKRFVEREYLVDKEIVKQGMGGEGFFIIISGQVDVIRERTDGTMVVVNHFGPGDYFGELALLDDGVRTASIIAKEATNCLVLTRWDFLGTVREDAEMAVEILQELAKRFRLALEVL